MEVTLFKRHPVELTPAEIEEKAEQLYAYVMRFIKNKHTYAEIKQFLMDDGMDEITAKAIINSILLLAKKKAKTLMKNGAILLSFGVGLTVLSYIVAPYNHNIYIIFHGAIIVGIILILRGYSKSR